jgi:hypothetical protein
VEVALESLLRQWDDLAGWLREERQNLIAADDIERSATAWETHGQDPAWLMTGTRLIDAETLSTTQGFSSRITGARAYLAASRQAENERLAKEEEQRQAELRHAQERQQTAEAHAADLRKRARVLRAVLLMFAMVVLIIAAAVDIFVSTTLKTDVDNGIRTRALMLIDSGSLEADPGKAIEGTAYSDINATLIFPGKLIYTALQPDQTLPIGQPEKDVIEGKQPESLRTVDDQRVFAERLPNGSTLLLSKSLAATKTLLRQLGIVSLTIGAIAVAIAAVASATAIRGGPPHNRLRRG